MPPTGQSPAALLIGEGWFPDTPTGLTRYFRDLLTNLGATGVACEAIVVGPAEEAPANVAVAGLRGDRLPLRLWRIARAARTTDAPVVDAHFALYAALPVLLGRLRHRGLVVHFHGPWTDESVSRGERSALRIMAKRMLERAVYRRARVIVVLSTAFRRVLVERYRVTPWAIRVIPPAVDLERFTPGSRDECRSRLQVSPQDTVVVTVRRLVPRVGIETLIDAWGQVISARHGNAVLFIVGDGALRPALERQATEVADDRSVRFLGRVDDQMLADVYRAADFSVVPTSELEGFGLVMLESLACGTPVIATDVDGLGQALRRFDAGCVVPARDPHALGERIDDAISGARPLPDRASCRKYAEQFSFVRLVAEHERIYSDAKQPERGRRLRVVHLHHSAAVTGGAIGVQRIIEAMPDVDAHVILGEEGPFVERLLDSGISVEVLPLAARARTFRRERVRFADIPATVALSTAAHVLRLARRLRDLRPDIVQANSMKSLLYGGLAARLSSTAVVWHAHDRVARDYLPGSAVRLTRLLGSLLPHAIIANSAATAATLRPPRRGGGIQVIYYPLSADALQQPARLHAARRVDVRPLRIGMVGRISPWKGQHVFLEAFARAFPEGDEVAVIIGAPLFGGEEEQYETKLHNLVTEREIATRVEFRGFVDDVEAELADLDVLVHASIIPEPFGQVVTEGMAAGLPVVAPRTGGPAEVIADGVNGVLYAPADVEALAQCLRHLAEHPAERQRIAEAAQRRAADFAPARITAEVVEVYRSVAARHPSNDRR